MLPAMEHDQLWGWMAQLYSIRSAGSWGVGDFEDLKTLMVDSHSKTGAISCWSTRCTRASR